MEIQDSYAQVFYPEKQLVIFTQTKVFSQYDTINFGKTQKGSLAADPMLEMIFKYQTTKTIQKRTAYDSLKLFGDFGGLNDFIYLIIAPIMGLLLGDRYSFSLFRRLFWVNYQDPEENKHPD